MGISSKIKRTQTPLHPNDGECDESLRVYFTDDGELTPMPSVSTIKSLRCDPEKEEALEEWKNIFDGKSQYARPWWKDQQSFKAYRGTLVHFTILESLAQQSNHEISASGDTYFHRVGNDGWGYEEYYAAYALNKWSKKAPSANADDIPYVPRDNKYDGEHAWDRCYRDMTWAARAFKREIIDNGRLDPANVRDVETYVYYTPDNKPYAYGGQFDLLYEYTDGSERRTVLCDLKTSSGVWFDHRLQSAAYKRAIEQQKDIAIDECEVIRLYPDDEVVETSRSDRCGEYHGPVEVSTARDIRDEGRLLTIENDVALDEQYADDEVTVRYETESWDRSLEGLACEFEGLADKAWSCDYNEALEHAKAELIHNE